MSVNNVISVENTISDDSLTSKLNTLHLEGSISMDSSKLILQDAAKRQKWLDDHPDHPDRRARVTALVDLFEKCDPNVFPLSMLIKGLEKESDGRSRGKFADVYQGTFQGCTVAIKHFQVTVASNGVNLSKVHKRFRREALIWRQLRHPNILAFKGVNEAIFNSNAPISMVSPWMEHGALMEYLRKREGLTVKHGQLIKDIAAGLDYLHAQSFIHGDLHGANVLVNSDEQAVIGDFGLTCIEEMAHLSTTSLNKAGAPRWMSPELLHQEGDQAPQKTMSGDVFSFGRLCLSVYTRDVPYHYLTLDTTVTIRIVVYGEHPKRPTADECHGTAIPDTIWSIINRCWMEKPEERPIIRKIKNELDNLKF